LLRFKEIYTATSLLFLLALTFIWLLTEALLLLNIFINLSLVFPRDNSSLNLQFIIFFLICILNLFSIIIYSFPATTIILYNLYISLSAWLGSILILSIKSNNLKRLLPSRSPWYLIPFLSLVEAISNLVRPVTLSFRLIANISAGHILLTLILKLSWGVWLIRLRFSLLELIVCFVQAYVFTMLISVYFNEAK